MGIVPVRIRTEPDNDPQLSRFYANITEIRYKAFHCFLRTFWYSTDALNSHKLKPGRWHLQHIHFQSKYTLNRILQDKLQHIHFQSKYTLNRILQDKLQHIHLQSKYTLNRILQDKGFSIIIRWTYGSKVLLIIVTGRKKGFVVSEVIMVSD